MYVHPLVSETCYDAITSTLDSVSNFTTIKARNSNRLPRSFY